MANAQEEFAAIQKQRSALVAREKKAGEVPIEGTVHTPYKLDRRSWELRTKLAKEMRTQRRYDEHISLRAKEAARDDYRQAVGPILEHRQYTHYKRRRAPQFRFLGKIKTSALRPSAGNPYARGGRGQGTFRRTREQGMALQARKSPRPRKGKLRHTAATRYRYGALRGYEGPGGLKERAAVGVYGTSPLGRDPRFARPTVGGRRTGGAAQFLLSRAREQEYSALSSAHLT